MNAFGKTFAEEGIISKDILKRMVLIDVLYSAHPLKKY